MSFTIIANKISQSIYNCFSSNLLKINKTYDFEKYYNSYIKNVPYFDNSILEYPKDYRYGHLVSNISLKIAKFSDYSSFEIALILQKEIVKIDYIKKINVIKPGFINIFLNNFFLKDILFKILDQGFKYGNNNFLLNKKINIEFVSANPTGPIHIGGARWAVYGDCLAKLLSTQGAKVTKEYYFNDQGSQIEDFAQSLLFYINNHNNKDNKVSYKNSYTKKIANEIKINNKLFVNHSSITNDFKKKLCKLGTKIVLDDIKKSLFNFNIIFDVFFSENSLYKKHYMKKILNVLKKKGNLYHSEKAWWLNSSKYGDSKDRVVLKSNGNSSYFASDIAYLQNKFSRGFEINIYVLGADHHGYTKRLQASAEILGYQKNAVEVIIGQMVNIVDKNSLLKMSKRNNNILTLDNLLKFTSIDAAKYWLIRYPVNRSININFDIMNKQTNENYLFYVQYAYARTYSVYKKAKSFFNNSNFLKKNISFLNFNEESEVNLLLELTLYPKVVYQSASLRTPYKIARYIENLAYLYHKWYDSCRVIPYDIKKNNNKISNLYYCRFLLNNAVKQVLFNGLNLLNISRPKRM